MNNKMVRERICSFRRRSLLTLILSILFVSFVLCATASAARIAVTTLNDSGPGSLRQAIVDAAPGDTIYFSVTGTIVLTTGELVIDKNLTIKGPGADLLSINGNGERIFLIINGYTAKLGGITITNGFEQYGGGIYNAGTLTVSNSTISNNYAASSYAEGAGVFNTGTLTVNNCTIADNTADGSDVGYSYGGGIYNYGTLTVNGSTISGNYVSGLGNGELGGGGIYNAGTSTVHDSTISGNSLGFGDGNIGGGIYNHGTMAIGNSLIFGNAVYGANFTIDEGGGICNWGGLTISNSTITGNANPSGDGGGIYNFGGTLTISNCTVSYNGAGRLGGGIFVWTTSVAYLTNTIVAENGGSARDISGTVENSATHNLIGDPNSSGGIQNGMNGNIVGANPLLGPFQNNGGPTFTEGLLPGSPAINAGDDCVLIVNGCGYLHPALTTDQRGMPRRGNVDIGAFEVQGD